MSNNLSTWRDQLRATCLPGQFLACWRDMRSGALAAPFEVPVDSDTLFQTLVDRLQFDQAAQEWSRCVSSLSSWEGEHLLVDNPLPERRAQHKKVIERLMLFGQLCAFVASYPEFEDAETAEMIHATQLVLKD